MLLLLNKPFQVLSQFTSDDGKDTLASYVKTPNVYAAGRLDYDSEGLLLLTDQGALQHLIASPTFKMPKTYWAQVEGQITEDAISQLRAGVELKDGLTKPAKCRIISAPEIWPRTPPIRERASIPTSWIELIITEGKNRQVRRMTASVGFPTLRLIRAAIGPYSIAGISLGETKEVAITDALSQQVLDFERQKTRKTASPNRRSANRGPRKVPYGQGETGRRDRTEPARGSRRKR